MSDIQVNRGETKPGVFSAKEIKEGLRTGRFFSAEIGWPAGMATWVPFSQFPGIDPAELAAGATTMMEGLAWERSLHLMDPVYRALVQAGH